MGLNDWASRIAVYLASGTGQNKEVLSYGLEIMIGFALKGILMAGFSYLLGIFTSTMTVLFFAASLRLVSGGAHCSSYRRCLISGLLVFLSLGYIISKIYSFANRDIFTIASLVIFLFVLAVTYLWVPGENENRTFPTIEKRKKFKLFTLLLIIASYIFIFWIYYQNHILIAVSALTGLLWQSFSVTPAGYCFLRALDGSLYKLNL